MASSLTLETFDCEGDPTSVGARWERWKRALFVYLDASNIERSDKKRANLLHFGGIELQEIFSNIPGANVAPAENVDVFLIAIEKLDEYFAPKQSKIYERHVFRLLKQETNEKFEKFVVRLRQQADKCLFTAKTENIIDQITEKCLSTELRKKILQIGDDINLDKIIAEANSLEVVTKQMEQFGSNIHVQERVNKIDSKSKPKFERKEKEEICCGRCGNRRHKSSDSNCPARRKNCLKCGLEGHFRQYCKTRNITKRKWIEKKTTYNDKKKIKLLTVNNVEEIKEEEKPKDTYYVFHIDDDVEFDCIVGGVKTKMLIDSGCKHNLITESSWDVMKNNNVEVYNQIGSPDMKFMAYGSNKPLEIKGSFEATIQVGNKLDKTTFYVIINGTKNLLGKTTAMALGILRIGLNLDVNSIHTSVFPKFKDILIDLPIDDSVPPVSQPYRY